MITAMPCVLVADDDPVSLAFLVAAIQRMGCAAIAAATASDALNAGAANQADLLLLDRHLPDTEGPALLDMFRRRGVSAPAIATSAELDPVTCAALRAAGFIDTLAKPTTLAILRQLLQRHLGVQKIPTEAMELPASERAILDDSSALTALAGDLAALKALRKLFAQELEALEGDFEAASLGVSGGRLHRLRAACGFCGASLLADSALLLERALRAGDASTPARMDAFRQACRATRAALDAD